MVDCSWGCVKLSPVAMLVYFTLTNLLIYIDRGALSAVVTELKSSSGLDLSSSEAGLLGSIFMLGYMLASPIFAHFAQFVHPMFLMGVGLIIWALATFLAGISRTFWLLLIGRSLTGIGEASFVALAPPYIIDLAPSNNKSMWLAIFYSTLSVGNSLGFIYGNVVSNALGGWYWPFLIESFLMLPLIVLTFLLHKDKKFLVRRQNRSPTMLYQESDTDDTVSDTTSFKDQIKQLLSNKIYVLLVLGYSSYAFTLGGLIFWVASI